MTQRTLEEYLKLEYSITIEKKDDGYLSWHPDFGSEAIIGWGETREDAVKELDKARVVLINFMFEEGMTIPAPTSEEDLEDFSGKFVIRVPKFLHSKLVSEARRNGISLNTYANVLLSQRNAEDIIDKKLNTMMVFMKHKTIIGMEAYEPTEFLYSKDSERSSDAPEASFADAS